MLSSLIKLKYGFTLDKESTEREPCPKCGGVMCHVKENKSKVFCSNALCSYQDDILIGRDEPIINRLEYLLRYPPVFLSRVLYNNDYPLIKHPFMAKEDIEQGKFIIREFSLDRDKYQVLSQYGMSKQRCYRIDSPIIAKYATLKLLVADGWRPGADHPDLDDC